MWNGLQFCSVFEGNLHWNLDVTFNDVHNRMRNGQADIIISILRKAALSSLKYAENHQSRNQQPTTAVGWDEGSLEKGPLG